MDLHEPRQGRRGTGTASSGPCGGVRSFNNGTDQHPEFRSPISFHADGGLAVIRAILDARERPEAERLCHVGKVYSDSSAEPVPERGFGLAAGRGTIRGLSSPRGRTAA
jgi:hypothetical protein